MTAQELIALLESQDLKPRSYCGRGMFGFHCVAASMDRPGDYTLPPGWLQDALGTRVIVYWPKVGWPEGRS